MHSYFVLRAYGAIRLFPGQQISSSKNQNRPRRAPKKRQYLTTNKTNSISMNDQRIYEAPFLFITRFKNSPFGHITPANGRFILLRTEV